VAYRVKFQPGFIAFTACVECGEPLLSTVEKTVIPQDYDSQVTLNLQLNRSTRWQTTLLVLITVTSHGHRLFHED